MFNAVGQRGGRAWPASLIEEVSPEESTGRGKTTAILKGGDRRQESVCHTRRLVGDTPSQRSQSLVQLRLSRAVLSPRQCVQIELFSVSKCVL